jgi:hypothetical protein
MKNFKTLSEREILALAISLEEEDEQLGPPIINRTIYTQQADAEVEGLYRWCDRAIPKSHSEAALR